MNNNKPFSKIRSFLWPIYSHELKKLIPMFSLFFLISFVYNLLRNMKISVVVTLKDSGAQVIPFLKIVGVLPCALFMTYIFTILMNRFDRDKVFYTILVCFLLYFALFMMVLFPYQSKLELIMISNFVKDHIFTNEGFLGLIAIIRHWNLALFYILSEMWSAVVLSMLFWGFANEVTKINEAKRFYAIFALGANASGIFIGLFTNWLSKLNLYYISFYDEKYQWVFYQLLVILIIGVIVLFLFYMLNKYIIKDSNDCSLNNKKNNNNNKEEKLSLKECFLYLRRSSYLGYIVIIVITYNIVYNLADVMWTYKVKQIFNNSKDLNSYIAQISLTTGIIATISAFLISGNVIRHYGWTVAALITPVVWLCSSLGFFSSLLFENLVSSDMFYFFIGNPVYLVLFLGSIQVCFGRSCKYTVFDETKEISFIPLSKQEQRKSKAIVDGLASRIGKSSGSLIYVFLLMIFGDIVFTIPYVMILILCSIIMWIFAVISLGKMVNNSIDLEHSDKKK